MVRFRVLNRAFVACASAEAVRHILVGNHENYPRAYHSVNGVVVFGNGLIFNEGEEWLSRRRMILPSLRTESVQGLCAIANEETQKILGDWDAASQSGEPVDLLLEIHRLTISVMGRALLTSGVGREESDAFGDAIRESVVLLRRRNRRIYNAPTWVPTPQNRRLRSVQRTLDAFVERHLQARERMPEAEYPDDILSHMLRVRDPETGQAIPRGDLIVETKTLFAAGFETTGASLTWCLYLLAKHPEVAAKWRHEVDSVLAGGEPTTGNINRLEYTAAIVHEAMRMYPPVHGLSRDAVADDVISGRRIRAADTILLSIFGVHNDPSEWESPTEFRPERFLPGGAWKRESYIPFSVGKHRCIGNAFAQIEMLVALSLIAQRFELALPDGFESGENAFITLTPDRKIPLTLHRRP
jgi:cytochrome P450